MTIILRTYKCKTDTHSVSGLIIIFEAAVLIGGLNGIFGSKPV